MTDQQITDEVLDAVAAVVTDAPLSPSVLGRKAHVSTTDAQRALKWLAEQRFVVACGNGAWTKYRSRRFGERTA